MKTTWLCFSLLCLACVTACDLLDDDLIGEPVSQYWRAPMEYDVSGAKKSLRVAAVSLRINPSPEVNRDKIIDFVDKITTERPEVELILFPEAMLGYYSRSSNQAEYQRSVAEPIPGETTNSIAQEAAAHRIYISFGMIEKSGEDLYNSQVLIGPDGTILSVYHKCHLIESDKRAKIKPGEGIMVNVINNIKVAAAICADHNSIEITRQLHEAGVELVLLPVARESTFDDYTLVYPRTDSWLLSANRLGSEDGTSYNGVRYLCSPGGDHEVREIDSEGYIYGVVKCW